MRERSISSSPRLWHISEQSLIAYDHLDAERERPDDRTDGVDRFPDREFQCHHGDGRLHAFAVKTL